MQSKFIPVVLALSMMLGGAVFAATSDALGAIKAIDVKAMTVTLEDGTVYYFPATVKLDGFKVGETVKISWALMGGKDEASAITAQ